ncbi:DUF998 domain-containing protein [Micromonospora coxensis]|uniref:DUF998 domain-containing protein n=1 Tax=Micromonospora coxensis TaxID=356852 RepID=UPI00342F6697
MRDDRTNGLLALGGIALAATLAVIGHVEVNDDLDPWSLTVSDFAVSDRGGAIDVAMVVLAAASAHLFPALRGTRRPRVVGLLLAAWIGGLLLAAVVPTNEPGLPMDTAAYVHRYASVVAFLALPPAGWLLAERGTRAGVWLRGLVLAGLALAAATVWSAYLGDRALIGLAERLLILAEAGLLTVVAVGLVRRNRSATAGPDLGPARRRRTVTPARAA